MHAVPHSAVSILPYYRSRAQGIDAPASTSMYVVVARLIPRCLPFPSPLCPYVLIVTQLESSGSVLTVIEFQK
jgi:hypothetical protein